MPRTKKTARFALQAVLLVARWWALGLALARRANASLRPLSVELDASRERAARLAAENDLLRARLRKMPAKARPR